MNRARQGSVIVIVALALTGASGGASSSMHAPAATSLDPGPLPEGQIVYEMSYTGVRKGGWLEISDLDGSNRRVLTPIPGTNQRRWDLAPTWSPDGKSIAFVRSIGGSDAFRGKKQIRVVRVEENVEQRIAGGTGTNALGRPLWSTDGARLLFVRSERPSCSGFDALYTVAADGSSLRRVVRAERNRLLTQFDWSPDAASVLVEKSSWDTDCRDSDFLGSALSTLPLRGGGPKVIARAPAYAVLHFSDAAWSPDGRSIAFAAECARICQLFRVPSRGGKPKQLTAFRTPTAPYVDVFDELSLTWSRAEDALLYGRKRGLFSVDVRTAATRNLVTTPCPSRKTCGAGSETFVEAQSKDGDLVAYSTRFWSRNFDLVSAGLAVISLDGTRSWTLPYPRSDRPNVEIGFEVFLE